MKKLLVFSVFLSISIYSSAQWPYKRLDRLKSKSKAKCMAASKKYIKVFPERSAPYYFVSVVYFETVDSASNLRGKYVRMGNALLYARKFEATNDAEMRSKVGWEDIVSQMESRVNDLSVELNEAEMSNLSKRLYTKLERLEQIESIELIAEVDKTEKIEKVTVPATGRKTGHFYGMPTGKENIASNDLEQENEMLDLINKERVKLGMEELELIEDMSRACRYQAFDMGTQAYFDHDSHDRDARGNLLEVGGTFNRIRKFYNTTFTNAENIAAGNEDARSTYKQWYNSKGHYDNMFNPSAKRIGIGVVQVPDSPFIYYWVMCTAH